MVDLSVKIGDLTFQNPIQPASGAFSWEYNDVIDLNRLGALVAKTICREPRLGNPTPRMAETEAGIIQSIGLPGKGIDYFLENIVPEYAKFEPPLVVSVSSESAEAIADHFDGLSKLQRATVDDLSQVDGIDSVTAAEVRETLARVTESAILDQYN